MWVWLHRLFRLWLGLDRDRWARANRAGIVSWTAHPTRGFRVRRVINTHRRGLDEDSARATTEKMSVVGAGAFGGMDVETMLRCFREELTGYDLNIYVSATNPAKDGDADSSAKDSSKEGVNFSGIMGFFAMTVPLGRRFR